MLVEIKSRSGGEMFWIQAELVETILERQGNTSEIVLVNGTRHTSIWSPQKVAETINEALSEVHIPEPKGP